MNSQKKAYIIYFLIILVFLNFMIFDRIIAVFESQKINNNFSVSFLDVGQGDAILIQTPDEKQILIDGGPSNENLNQELTEILPPGDRYIDVILVTHADKDHLGGFVGLTNDYDIGLTLTNSPSDENNLYQDWIRELEKNNVEIKNFSAGEDLIYKSKEDKILFTLESLSPFENTIDNLDDNESSIVTRLDIQEISFLLTGDIGKETEKIINDIYKEDSLDIEILKVGHHGSKNSSSIEFINSLTPSYSVISCSENNSYGHPHEETLDTLSNSRILRTDIDGRISFIIKNDNLLVECEKTDCTAL